MSRFVFATVPLAGHTLPALPIARALVARGHSVRWYTGAAFADQVAAAGATHIPMSDFDFSVTDLDDYYPERLQHQGIRRLQFDLVAAFARPVATHLRDLQAALAEEPADVLVGDMGMIAGPILADLGGPSFAAFGISVVPYPEPGIAPMGFGLAPASGLFSRVRNSVADSLIQALMVKPLMKHVNQTRASFGLPAAKVALGYPAHCDLFLQLSTPGFEYPRTELPSAVHYIGPARPAVTRDWEPPTWWPELVTSSRPVVLVTQGTLTTDDRELIRPTLAALADEDVLVVVATGGPDPAGLGPLPANVRVERFIPFDQLLPHVDVYVTNGGFGGVQLALSHGVPIVAAGRTEDKAEVAARVAYTGVGLNLATQKPKPAQVRSAVRQVLGDDRFAVAAGRVQAEIAAAGREEQGADLLEQLALGGGREGAETPTGSTPALSGQEAQA